MVMQSGLKICHIDLLQIVKVLRKHFNRVVNIQKVFSAVLVGSLLMDQNLLGEEAGGVCEEHLFRLRERVSVLFAKGWCLTVIYFMAMISWNGMSLWMPQIMKVFSSQYSNTTVGILVMISYFVALMVMIGVARHSDRTLERRYHAAIPLLVAAICLAVLAMNMSGSTLASVLLWCAAVSGAGSVWGPFWSLPNEFLAGYSAAAGIALINSIGNLGGFVGSYAIGAISHRTRSFRGGVVFLCLSFVTSAILMLALRKSTSERATPTLEPSTMPDVNP